MNILYIASSFPKENVGDTIYTDLVEALNKRNHNIDVVIFDQKIEHESADLKVERNVNVLRVPVKGYYNVGFVRKTITMITLPSIIKKSIKFFYPNKIYDLILFDAPPVTLYKVVKWAMKNFNCSSYLMQKDIFPQNAVDIKIISKLNPMYTYFRYMEKQMLKTATWIGCMSQKNIDYLLEHNSFLISEKLELFPNTKKIKSLDLIKSNLNLRNKYNISDKACVFIFGGNMGKPQYVDLLCKMIIKFKDDNDKFFLFIGRGTDKNKIADNINKYNITNSILLDNIPRNEYEEFLCISDVGIITLNPNFTIPNYPSRILSYMEYSLPVIVATDVNTDFQDLITSTNCGIWCKSSDEETFFNSIDVLANDETLRSMMGFNGRQILEKELKVEVSVSILESHFI